MIIANAPPDEATLHVLYEGRRQNTSKWEALILTTGHLPRNDNIFETVIYH